MMIVETFIENILKTDFSENYQSVYDNSPLLQYLDKKMKAVHGNSKARRSLGSIYAIYSILHFYQKDFFKKPGKYRQFEGYDYMLLFNHCRNLYGGGKLQNHALNSRVNSEFKNLCKTVSNDLIIVNNGKYMLHIDYLYVKKMDISRTCCRIIEKYIELLRTKDLALSRLLHEIQILKNDNEKKMRILELLTEDSEARIFEIICFAILKNHYKNISLSTKIYG
ncbi:MAG: hypothetical protein Q4G69_11420 [Planctomycetia bacterium]|nr:hypothetical protein [Planctomycetia bacterium]